MTILDAEAVELRNAVKKKQVFINLKYIKRISEYHNYH